MQVHIGTFDDYKLDEILAFIRTRAEQDKVAERLADARHVLIKPNLLGAFPPEKAVTAHPIVVEAMIVYLLELGKQVTVGDGPGGTVPWERVIKMTGMAELCARYPVDLVCLQDTGASLHEGSDVPLCNAVEKADAVISIGKYKTHSLMLYTGAVKNLYGLVPGLHKANLHRKYPMPKDFRHILTDIYRYVSPKIAWHMVDGILGMEGEGPSAGKVRRFGVLFTSCSGAALDLTAARMMGFREGDIPYVLEALTDEGLRPDDVTVEKSWRGFVFPRVALGEVKLRQWLVDRLPRPIFTLMRKLFDFSPRFTTRCRRCGVCRDGCPMKAITLNPGDQLPILDPKKCIKCMCCHELCPFSAVEIHKTWVTRLFLRS